MVTVLLFLFLSLSLCSELGPRREREEAVEGLYHDNCVLGGFGFYNYIEDSVKHG